MDTMDRAIGIASKFRKSLAQDEMLLLAKMIQKEMKAAVLEDRKDRVDAMTRQLETLLVECDALETKLRLGEDEAPEEITTFQEYKNWRAGLVNELYAKRAEYRALKLSRHSVNLQHKNT